MHVRLNMCICKITAARCQQQQATNMSHHFNGCPSNSNQISLLLSVSATARWKWRLTFSVTSVMYEKRGTSSWAGEKRQKCNFVTTTVISQKYVQFGDDKNTFTIKKKLVWPSSGYFGSSVRHIFLRLRKSRPVESVCTIGNYVAVLLSKND